MPPLGSLPLVCQLRHAENELVQSLLTQFELVRDGSGARLIVRLDESTPAIRLRESKTEVRRWGLAFPDWRTKAVSYQRDLDRFLLEGIGERYPFDDPEFCFRYVSGGTLPVVRLTGHDYYCLFYRDVFPIGWNIANGGSDTRDELLHPVEAIERELREELIAVDPRGKRRYVFARDAGLPVDHPQFAVARRIWQERVCRRGDFARFDELQEEAVVLKWLKGPDAVDVIFAHGEGEAKKEEPPVTTRDCFLSITTEDFGIEIDRVAKIKIDENTILCDGEIIGRRLANRPIGLFEVDKMNRGVLAGEQEFIPDLFFHDALPSRLGKELRAVVEREIRDDMLTFRSPKETDEFDQCPAKYKLCPVTERIIGRYANAPAADEATALSTDVEVFITYGGAAEERAKDVYQYLENQLHTRAFFAPEKVRRMDFQEEIDDALESARVLIAVATAPDQLRRRWPKYEYSAFHKDFCGGVKPVAHIISFIAGFGIEQLPLMLRSYTVIQCDPADWQRSLPELAKYVR